MKVELYSRKTVLDFTVRGFNLIPYFVLINIEKEIPFKTTVDRVDRFRCGYITVTYDGLWTEEREKQVFDAIDKVLTDYATSK